MVDKTMLLEIKDLRTYFHIGKRIVKAVDGIDLNVSQGQVMAIVGESGCGKSVTSLSVMRLVPTPPARISGEILFGGQDILKMSMEEVRAVRGKEISMIFQEPMTSLNPAYTVGEQIAEVVRIHSKTNAWSRAVEMLDLVGIPSPSARAKDYPHQMSGGMRQRVMIAMALACNPKLLLADEPTTALDVTIQAQILDLIRKLAAEFNTALVLITHDLGVVLKWPRIWQSCTQGGSWNRERWRRYLPRRCIRIPQACWNPFHGWMAPRNTCCTRLKAWCRTFPAFLKGVRLPTAVSTCRTFAERNVRHYLDNRMVVRLPAIFRWEAYHESM